MTQLDRGKKTPKMCTTSSRYEEYNKIQLCRFHASRTRATICTPSKPRQLGQVAELLVLHNAADRQCSQEVHYYLREMFEEARKIKDFQTSRVHHFKPIISARAAARGSPANQRVTFSALGLPSQRTRVRKQQSPTKSLISDPLVACRESEDQRVFIKLSRPTPEQTQPSRTVRKQTFRPFCLIKGPREPTERLRPTAVSAPPSSPQLSDQLPLGIV
ncbi:hypothetical protein ACHWQZ_G016550 [Mnemiopsis leidyi]